MKILAVLASPRQKSLSEAALHFCAPVARQFDAEFLILDLRETALPLYEPETASAAENFAAIKDLVDASDALILATPDYHGSMSGMLKNFLDYFWTEFAGKTFGYICASHEKGLTAMDQIRTVVRQCYGWSLPYGVAVSNADVDEENRIVRPAKQARLEMFIRDMTVYGRLLTRQRREDLTSDEVRTFMAKYRP